MSSLEKWWKTNASHKEYRDDTELTLWPSLLLIGIIFQDLFKKHMFNYCNSMLHVLSLEYYFKGFKGVFNVMIVQLRKMKLIDSSG